MTLRLLLLPALFLPACGCGDGEGPPPAADAGPDAEPPVPEGGPEAGADAGCDQDVLGRPCEAGDRCDDFVDCTVDSCDVECGLCRNEPNDIPCGDELFCNGNEVCDPPQGCVPGPPLSCTDEDVCTIDSCNEDTDECLHAPRDFDGDGHADWHCEGGDDCDDTNPRVFVGAPEICGDTFDNDCNGLVDLEEDCDPPGSDWCEGAVDASGGGVFEMQMSGTFSDYDLSCGFGMTHDAALTFTLDEPRDVEITADAELTLAAVALGDSCEDDALAEPPEHVFDELECNWGFPGRVRRRSVPAGTYWIIVATNTDDPAIVRVTFSEPTPPEPNESCDSPVDVSAGGVWEGSFVDVADDHPLSCGFADGELVYEFTLDARRDVVVVATSDDGRSLSAGVQTTCGNAATELRCAYGAPADFRIYSLDPGRYYLLVESGTENEFTLEVSFEDPSSPPEGDTCDDPIDASAGGVFAGDLGDMQDDHSTRCGFHYREAVYEIVLEDTKDVLLEAESAGFMYMSIRTDCDNQGTELRCVYGDPATARFRSLGPGTYYVLVESFQRADYTLTVEITDPVDIVDVAGNDTCTGDEYVIPVPEGGVFRGDTTGMGADYTANCGFNAGSPDATFRFELDEATTVNASLAGSSYDAVLHLHRGTCNLIDILACNDDWLGDEAFITRPDVAAGTYFLVVDGFGAVSDGAYVLEVWFE